MLRNIENNTTSKYKGKISKAYIIINFIPIHLGTFTAELEAAEAYNNKVRELYMAYMPTRT